MTRLRRLTLTICAFHLGFSLAVYDHPTPQSLMLPSGQGGFRNGENSMVYAQLTVWLIPLVLGYGLALVHLEVWPETPILPKLSFS